eukprot:Skav229231  [mRNA]  locus=scaffold864:277248:282087:- [translate_table: standard]
MSGKPSEKVTGAKQELTSRESLTSMEAANSGHGDRPWKRTQKFTDAALSKAESFPPFFRQKEGASSPATSGLFSVGHAHEFTFSGGEATSAIPGADHVDSGAPPKKSWPLGCRLKDLGDGLLKRFLGLSFHSKPTGKGEQSKLFPLPTSRTEITRFLGTATHGEVSWVLCICLALNSLWGNSLTNDGEISPLQGRVLEGFLNDVHRLDTIGDVVEDFDWTSFFRSRTVDYQGEEVKTAKRFCWQNIKPAMPPKIGVVALVDVCEYGCRHYIENFPEYLKTVEEWPSIKPSRVMVSDQDWGEVARNLVACGMCEVIPDSEVFRANGQAVRNGLFGVEKGEVVNGFPVYRLIMNLVPLNALALQLDADIRTLPHWMGMNPFSLEVSEGLLVSSEDIRCFFYTLKLPRCWLPFLSFNKEVPSDLRPPGCTEPCFLTATVLPMGFLNSVGIAQHVHRVLVNRSKTSPEMPLYNREIRKDMVLPEAPATWRVYLDNFDLLEKFPIETLDDLEGTMAEEVESLRESYHAAGMPRHEGKAVTRSGRAEVQGAIIDGKLGLAYPKGSKLAKYTVMGILLVARGWCSQKEAQVVCGGLVYFSLFRRQLLGGLNAVWIFIRSFDVRGRARLPIPPEVKLELLRFLALVPLCRLDFRLPLKPRVSCSDASQSGGGLCLSSALSPAGVSVSQGSLRCLQDPSGGFPSVLSIGLFDGVGCLRVALDLVGASVAGHISVEKQESGRKVVEYHFPNSIHLDDVAKVTEEQVKQWSITFGQVALVLIGSGPPCQGVSGLNASRRGALGDERSSLFSHVPRVTLLVRKWFPWAQVHSLMESVSSMDEKDRNIMSDAFGCEPWDIGAEFMTWCRRPRLYWITWPLFEEEGVSFDERTVFFEADLPLKECISKGWTKVDSSRAFPTFTTSRPRTSPGHRPAGLQHCDQATVERWQKDAYRYPPYQYLQGNLVQNRKSELRLPTISEKEFMMGLPVGYTVPSVSKAQRKTQESLDLRHTLVGNAWSVPVVSVLIGQLLRPLGMCSRSKPQEVVNALLPFHQVDVRTRLLRPGLNPESSEAFPKESSTFVSPEQRLASLLSKLVSAKGEDLLLNSSSDQVASFQRLRQTVPARLWKWRIIAGWKWRHSGEHINSLELRAVLASIRWRVEHRQEIGCKFIHLTDSLVSLHAASRGRTSSKKLRRTMQRQALGTLRSLTVQPSTRKRYDQALDRFLTFLHDNDLQLPRQRLKIDALAAEYMEFLWASGFGRGLASDTLAALQDQDPRLKHNLQLSWRLLRTWHTHEIPNRAPPFPEYIVHCLTGWALMRGNFAFAASVIIGFYGMLRTGELLALKKADFSLSARSGVVVISLGLTKAGKRVGIAESVTLTHELAVRFVKRWMQLASPNQLLVSSHAKWRAMFSMALSDLKLTQFEFRPYSMRRGGATFYFGRHGSLDRVMVQGRWQAARTARMYLNESQAALAEMKFEAISSLLKPYLTTFLRTSLDSIQTLEPANTARAGGRGKGSKASRKDRPKRSKAKKGKARKKKFLVPRVLNCRGLAGVKGGNNEQSLGSSSPIR